MKKSILTIVVLLICLLFGITAQAGNLNEILPASFDTNTVATVVNTATFGGARTYTGAAISYAAGITNTVNVLATIGGNDFQLGTSSVTNATGASYDWIDLKPLLIRKGDSVKVSSGSTNVVLQLLWE